MKYLLYVITVLLLLAYSQQDESEGDDSPTAAMAEKIATPSEQSSEAEEPTTIPTPLEEVPSGQQDTGSSVGKVNASEALQLPKSDDASSPEVQIAIIPADPIVNETQQLSITFRCLKEDSKKCVIPEMRASDASGGVALPDLAQKTMLHIKGGQVKRFTKELSEQLADIVKLQLGPLEMEELYLKPELVEVEAIGNRLSAVTFASNVNYRTRILKLNDNRLQSLDGFEALVKLEELHLSSNALQDINMLVFDKMMDLELLLLDRNQIVAVEAARAVKLPYLSHFSLAQNNVFGSLNVTNWDFESLIELDISFNNITRIDGLPDRFPSLNNIFLAHNSWHCMLLDEMLNQIADSYVTVKDSDQECEGLSPANICCSAESDSNLAYDESFHKLEELENQQKLLQQTFSDRIRKLTSSQGAKLTDAKKRLFQLLGVDIGTGKNLTQDALNKSDFVAIRNDVQSLSGTLGAEKEKLKKLTDEATRTQHRLRHSVAELRRGLRREAAKIGELQAQFALLKDYVSSKRS